MLRHELQRSDARFTAQRCSRTSAPYSPPSGTVPSLLRQGHSFVQPTTLSRWHRDLVAEPLDLPQSRPGRPEVLPGTMALVLRLPRKALSGVTEGYSHGPVKGWPDYPVSGLKLACATRCHAEPLQTNTDRRGAGPGVYGLPLIVPVVVT